MDGDSKNEENNNIASIPLHRQGDDDLRSGEAKRRCAPGSVVGHSNGNVRHRIEHIPLGQFGFRRSGGKSSERPVRMLRIFPNDHLSTKETPIVIEGCGQSEIMLRWYNDLPFAVKHKLQITGLQPLIQGLTCTDADSALLQSLAEKWWDTTHTFHIDEIGEMTMTPKDFAAISALRTGGKPILLDKNIHRKKSVLVKWLGKPIGRISGRSVTVQWIYENYRHTVCSNRKEEDQLVRVFIIALLGATIFARPNSRVHLYYLPCIRDISDIGQYNWGGAALAFMYQQMDDLCRGHAYKIGGLWRCWEVWGREYFSCLRVNEPEEASTFPRCLRWINCKPPRMEVPVLLQYYRKKLRTVRFDGVDWSPWGDETKVPSYVAESLIPTGRRIVLVGPDGGEWYLGERVSVQSMSTAAFLIPKHPPRSMLVREKFTVITKKWVVDGKPAHEFVGDESNMTYDAYRKKWLSSTTLGKEIADDDSHHFARTNAADADESLEDVIPIPPWTLLVPSTSGGPNVICIPTNVGIENLHIPPHVKQVSVATAKKLLRMIAGMQHVLIEHVTDARETLRDYAAIIQNLQHQLHERTEPDTGLPGGVHEECGDNVGDVNRDYRSNQFCIPFKRY